MEDAKNFNAISDNSYVSNLKRTKKQEVLEAIESIVYDHRIGISGMMGPLSANEAEREYERLLNALPIIPGLTVEEQEELAAIINQKVKEIPNVEEEKRVEYEQAEQAHKDAFERAKARFEALSPIRKLKLTLAGKDPAKIDTFWMSIQEIDKLYEGRD